MAIGDKIRIIRKMRNMTQKELGIAIGLPKNSADIRMTQYETGVRVPKENLVTKIAKVLKVEPSFLMAPASKDKKDVMNFLFYLDDYGLLDLNMHTENFDDEVEETSVQISFDYLEGLLHEWYDKKKQYEQGVISEEEYVDWKCNWSKEEEKITIHDIGPTLSFD